MLKDSGRTEQVDKKFAQDVKGDRFINILFVRLVAKKIKFTDIDFRYCIFDASYLRYCVFDSCDFTGCRFINSNLQGSSFNGCTFDYATFDKTNIDSDILNSGCPGPENLKLKFSRSLRMNYQSLGDAASANRAISIELQATEDHLHKAWRSPESYYRNKYNGLNRLKAFGQWVEFKALDLVWGNGESTWKLVRAVITVMILIAIVDVYKFGNVNEITDYISSFLLSPQILLGVSSPEHYPGWYLSLIFLIRLIMFGFFMSIIIKRFNRR